jgi:muconolactone delta-isomerase
MARRKSMTSMLFKAARLSASARAVESGDPKKMERRAKNVVVGRALGKAGVWRRLWR